MSRKQVATKAPPPPGDPGAAEQRAIERARARVEARSPRARVEHVRHEDGRLEIVGGGHSDHHGWFARLQDVFGTRGTDFTMSQLNRLISAAQAKDGKIDGAKLNGLLAMVEGASPANEVQGALAVQMALVHSAAQTLLQRAMAVDQIPQFESASNTAVKLLRTFALQAETLAKLQRGGEQIVKVVHVHPGGQAIVGNVVNGHEQSDGGRGRDERWNQPYAKAQLPAPGAEPMPQVWSQDAERQRVPVTSRQR